MMDVLFLFVCIYLMNRITFLSKFRICHCQTPTSFTCTDIINFGSTFIDFFVFVFFRAAPSHQHRYAR